MFINPKELLKDDLYYIMNGFEDVTEELNKQGLYVPKGVLNSFYNGSWEMDGYIYETFRYKFYRKPKN